MLALAESENLFAHHDHAGFKTVVAGPHVVKSLDRTLRVNNEDIIRHPYPTWIIQTDIADFYLEHFSDFEPGYEESPNQIVKKNKDINGNYISEEVLVQFERRNSTKAGHYEYHLFSGLDVSGLTVPKGIEDPSPGFVGRLWIRKDKNIWKYIANILTGNEKYRMPKGAVDPSVELFLTQQIHPDQPTGLHLVADFSDSVNQAA